MNNGKQRFRFCPKCGGKLLYSLRHDRQRLTCTKCSYIMYENPIVGVATIITKDEQILLGKRAQHSTYPGLWCIPCGYVEYNEDVYLAAKRECFEETGLIIDITGIFTVLSNFHNPETHTVGIWFTTKVNDGLLKAGDDIEEVGYFPLKEVPKLAFPTDEVVIKMLMTRLINKLRV